jgi:hypothetical protein
MVEISFRHRKRKKLPTLEQLFCLLSTILDGTLLVETVATPNKSVTGIMVSTFWIGWTAIRTLGQLCV